MAKLTWDAVGERLYETGTKRGVLYKQDASGAYSTGVPWNGLVSVKQAPDGAEPTPIYANDAKYIEMTSAENFKGTIDAFTYPDEFAECDGSAELVTASGVYAGQQPRVPFGLVYSTVVGNDTLGNDYGEKIHIIYNSKVAPSSRDYETINETPNAITFSWSFSTTPVSVDDIPALKRATSYICVDTTKTDEAKVEALKDLLYGTDADEAELPTLAELVALLTAA